MMKMNDKDIHFGKIFEKLVKNQRDYKSFSHKIINSMMKMNDKDIHFGKIFEKLIKNQ